MTTSSGAANAMQAEIDEFTAILTQQGVPAALRYLNSRTPHRYTGIFRFDGDTLRNEALFDQFDPGVTRGQDTPIHETYCSLVGGQAAPLEILDATTDGRVIGVVETPVVSYCGVLIRDAAGKAFGTLCHYDMHRCQVRSTDLPLLNAAGALLYQQLPPAATA